MIPTARREPPTAPSPERALVHLTCETLALGCLFERRGDVFIRIPVQRRQQMTGCEWHCRREGGLLRRVSYTLEPLEGWVALAGEGPGRVAAQYRSLLGRPEIREAELTWRSDVFIRTPEGPVLAFAAGSYNPLNAWNTVRGAVHLNGGVEAGFDAPPCRGAEPALLRLADGVPERGLLFLRDRDRTCAVLRGVPREGEAGAVRRIELAVPEDEDWSLGDLTLPDGERFTPLGLFYALLGGPPPGWEPVARMARAGRDAGSRPGGTFLPGPMIAEAMLRQVWPGGMAAALA